MKKVAIVGFGFMGRMHYGAWKKTKGAKVVAICDMNLAQLKNARGGNLAGADTSTDFTGIDVYDDFSKMLAAGGFDAVDITLPTPLHPDMTAQALKAGYHVLCEKPMALDRRACDRMLAAARGAKGRLMVAQCLRFWPEYVHLRQLVEKGTYGRVLAADFSRMSAPPGWNTGGKSWFLDESRSGGVILDFHIHDVDMINALFGLPKSVRTAAHRHADGWMDHVHTVYSYADKVVTSSCSWAGSASFVFRSGFTVLFEKATVVCDSQAAQPYRVFPAKGKPFTPKLSKRSGYENEVAWFLAWIEGRVAKGPLTAKDARDSVALVDAERRSAVTNKEVRI